MTLSMARRSVPLRQSPPADRPANRVAMQITGRPYISHSQLSLMRQCPRKFAFQYVENAPMDFQASSLLFGSSIHAVLEAHFRSLLEGVSMEAGDLLHTFRSAWQQQQESVESGLSDVSRRMFPGALPGVIPGVIPGELPGAGVPIRFNKNEDLGTLTDLAQRMIQAFLQSPAAHPHGRIVGIEESLLATLDPQLPDVLARVDLVTQTEAHDPAPVSLDDAGQGDGIHVVDWKTSRSRWNEQKVAENADQLLLYGQTILRMAEDLGLPVKLHFVVVTKAKSPVIQVLDVPVSTERQTAVRDHVAQVWEAIRTENYFANPNPLSCGICPYKSRCPAFKSSVNVPVSVTPADSTTVNSLDNIPI